MGTPEGFEEFVRYRYSHLLNLAFLLTGGSQDEAENLVQATLAGQLARWDAIDDPLPYLRGAIAARYLGGLRLRIRELRAGAATQAPVPEDAWSAVRALPSRARAALVARYWLDLSEPEAAHLLGWSSATLQHWAGQGLTTVRAVLVAQRTRADDGGEPETAEVEAFLTGELCRAVEPLRPRPDPTARAVRRYRAGRLRRSLVAGGLAVALAAGVTAGLLQPGQPEPQAAPSTPVPFGTFGGRVGWADKLAMGEPRGALAGEAFAAAVTDRVRELVRDNRNVSPHLWSSARVPDPEQEVRLVFADEIAGQRIVVLSLRRRFVEPYEAASGAEGHVGRLRLAWLAGPSGAGAETLLSALSADPEPGALAGSVYGNPVSQITITGQPREWTDGASGRYDPFECVAGLPCTAITLAPGQCEFSTATPQNSAPRRPEPTGSYLVRTAATFRIEYWWVTCDGMDHAGQRGVTPTDLMTSWQEAHVPDLSAALAEARGVTEAERDSADVRALAAGCLDALLAQAVHQLAAQPRPRVLWTSSTPGFTLVFHGPFDGDDGSDPRGMVAVAPGVDGTWHVVVCGDPGRAVQGGFLRTTALRVAWDPDDPLAVEVGNWDDGSNEYRVLVLPPAGATSVRLTDTETGEVLAELAVTNGYASATVNEAGQERAMRATVLGPQGAVLSTVAVSRGDDYPGEVDWRYQDWFENW